MNTTLLIVEYSDLDSERMNNGGHGKIGYKVGNVSQVVIPSVKGHSFDLPKDFTVVSPHANPNWDTAGAYMPPCSGGRGHSYYATVKAVHETPAGEEAELLGKGMIQLGKY